MDRLGGTKENPVFGLDIGTRSIVGTVGYMEEGYFHVVAQCQKEQETRAMLDGQIHDIAKVGQTVKYVREQLEKKLGRELKEACIAAAGRVLKTVTVHVVDEYEAERAVTEDDVFALQALGAQKAYEDFQANNETDIVFYCVGYTPIRYYLNGYQITNPQGHKAKNIGIDLIATFLPDDVVDGLYKAVEYAGLSVANMTLEPIAAIRVAIPEKYRMLNMALVDVGAGTSDICITKEGTITAYGMIPVAGDSLTNDIMQHCLVEFDVAEQMKRQVSTMDVISYVDIFGNEQTMTAQELKAILLPGMLKMTGLVAQKITELNGDKPVGAVFIVGGGGTIEGYTEMLAEQLSIVKERVAIRGKEVMQEIAFEEEDAQKDSLMVTPIGICISYFEQGNTFTFVELNGLRTKLYNNGKLCVADVAMQAEYPNEKLFPQRGKSITYAVNGEERVQKGLLGEPAVITLNGNLADITSVVKNGDKIHVSPSTKGKAASLILSQIPEVKEKITVTVNRMEYKVSKAALKNGQKLDDQYAIGDGDSIEILDYYTVMDLCERLAIPMAEDIYVNGAVGNGETKVYEGFDVSVIKKMEVKPEPIIIKAATLIQEVVQDAGNVAVPDSEKAEETPLSADNSVQAEEAIQDRVLEPGLPLDSTEEDAPIGEEDLSAKAAALNAKIQALNKKLESKLEAEPMYSGTMKTRTVEKPALVAMSGEEMVVLPEISTPPVRNVDGSTIVVVNHAPITMKGKNHYVFVDVFDYIHFDLTHRPEGKRIVTNLNGRQAQYMEEIKDGDIIDIYWD